MSKPTIAIIGYGDFSKLMIKHLSPLADILVASRQKKLNKAGFEFKPVGLKTALAQDIIIPSMPSQFLEDFFTQNKPLLNPNALVIDICSVKVKPVQTLLKILPKTTQILATHPMFGPASANNGIAGQRIMVHPVRIPTGRYQKIKLFLAGTLKLEIIETTPEMHDRMMAYAQGLSHYIGRAMQEMKIPEGELTTKAYNDLLDMKRIQGNDSWDLFESIMFENPYALGVNKKFKRTLRTLDERLDIK
jgi:prephenate dehydrogenase